MKEELLAREKREYPTPKEIPAGDMKLQVFPFEFVLNKIEEMLIIIVLGAVVRVVSASFSGAARLRFLESQIIKA